MRGPAPIRLISLIFPPCSASGLGEAGASRKKGEKLRRALDKTQSPFYKPSTRDARAQVAQLVEHATENRSVGGSIPPLGTTLAPLKATASGAFSL
jgi:hypothetical protein